MEAYEKIYLLLGLLILSSCSPTNVNSNSTSFEDNNEDPYVTSLEVISKAKKNNYIVGESFDTTGLKLMAKWSDNIDDELYDGEFTISPKIFSKGDKNVTFTYEECSLDYPVEVISMDDIKLNNLRVDDSLIEKNGPTRYVNFKDKLTVEAINLDNSIEVLDNYIIKDNDEIITDSNYFVGAGEHNISIEYGDKSYKFTMFGNYSLIEAETKSNENEFFYTDLIGNGVMNSSGKEDTPRISNIETASNNTYIGEIAYGRGLIFNFYSNKNMKANLMLNASSAYTLEVGVNEDGTSSWAPTRAGDIYLDETFNCEFNNKETILSHEKLEGMEWTLDKKGSYSIFANWKLVNLGEFNIEKGFNSVKLICIGANDEKGNAKLANIDYLKVDFIDNNHIHKLNKIEGKESTCTTSGMNTYYSCACGKMFLDEQCKEEITSLPIIPALGHNLIWENEIGTCSRCGKVVNKEIVIEAEHNNSLSLEEFEKYKKTGNYVEIESSKMDGKNQGSYLGSIYKNDKITFHIYSEISQKASFNMIGSSNYVLNYDTDGNPKDIGDAEINKIFTMKVNGKQLSIPNDVCYKGQKYDKGGWDERFTKWENLKILDIDLKVGDNTIVLEFQCPSFSCPTHPWGGNSDMTINIDKILIDYLI
mgnify:CR=1 FL=1